jgi:hypothetical protein
MRHRPSERALGAHSRRLEHLLPLGHVDRVAGHRQHPLEALAIGENERVAANRDRHLNQRTTCIDADRGSRCARIGRPSVRLLDLEQLHAYRRERLAEHR